MDMYKKREIRKKKREENNEFDKSCTSVNINWYPGHMAKTKRLIKEKYNLIDVVYELVDARIPKSSKISDIESLIKNKPRVLIMTKYDLCDKEETGKWIEYYESKGYVVYPCNLNDVNATKNLVKITENMISGIQENRALKGLKEKEIRALVIGIPNVGKSTLINKMAKRQAVNTGNTPGLTKALSFIKTDSNILLLDTPGILWPKFDNDEIGLNLASMTAIKSEILPIDDVAVHILKTMYKYYPEMLAERYNLHEVDEDFIEVYETIGKRFGALISGGEVDYDRVSGIVLNDIKNEYIKNITFDRRG